MNDVEYTLIKKRLRVLTGLDLDAYKSPQMQRRLSGYLDRARASSWPELLHRVEHDPVALAQLRDFLTINVSSFFRDVRKWDELRDTIVPLIVRRGQPLRVWSAACSHGAEPYSLAMLLQEHPMVTRFRVDATDIDRSILRKARAGGPYTPEDMREVQPHLLARYFRLDEQGYWVTPSLRERVTFAEKDLLRPVDAAYDLVVCRNVLIYFTEAAKAKVISNLVDALAAGGVIFIGATETIAQSQSLGVERVGLSSFYRKVAR